MDMLYSATDLNAKHFYAYVKCRYTWDTPIQEFWIAFNDEVQQVNDQPHSIEMVHHPNGLSNVKGRSKNMIWWDKYKNHMIRLEQKTDEAGNQSRFILIAT